MKFFIKVKPNAKHDRIEPLNADHFTVSVKAPPLEGRANQAVIEIVAEYLHVPKSFVQIISGKSSQNKVIEIID